MKFNKYLGVSLIGAVALMSLACHKHTFTVGAGGNTEGEAAYDKWESHWFFGIIGDSEVDVAKICPSGNATIKDQQSFLNGLVAAFVGIVWSPTTVTVHCDSGKAEAPGAESAGRDVQIHLSANDVRRIAHDTRTMAWAERVSPRAAGELASALAAEARGDTQIAQTEEPLSF
jgi:hypothetical protein